MWERTGSLRKDAGPTRTAGDAQGHRAHGEHAASPQRRRLRGYSHVGPVGRVEGEQFVTAQVSVDVVAREPRGRQRHVPVEHDVPGDEGERQPQPNRQALGSP